MDRIIVAYDGSELARDAFAVSVMLAEAARVPITGLMVIEPDWEGAGAAADPFVPVRDAAPQPRDERHLRREAERALSDLAAYTATRKVEFRPLVETGELRRVLARVAGDGDLLAVGRHGRFAGAGFGSTTRWLIGQSPCPVMVVPGALHPVNRVLGVADGTAHASRALEWARDVARQADWPLTVLGVTGRGHSMEDAEAEAARVDPDAQVLHWGPEDRTEAEQIEDAAEHASYALIVMAAFSDATLFRFLLGGTMAEVLWKVNSPVVLVP